MKRKRSFAYLLRLLLAVYIPLLLLNFTISFMIIRHIREQTISLLRANMDIYAGEIDNRLESVNYMLLNTLFSEQALLLCRQPEDVIDEINATNRLKKRFAEGRISFGNEYNYFLWAQDWDGFISSSSDSAAFLQFQAVLAHIKDLLHSPGLGALAEKNTWTVFEEGGSYYLIKIYRYQNQIIGAWAPAERVLSPLFRSSPEDGFLVILDEEGNILTGGEQAGDLPLPIEKGKGASIIKNRLVIPEGFKKGDFSVNCVITNWGAYENATRILLLLTFAAVLTLTVGLWLLLYVKRAIVDPVRRFSEHLRDYNESGAMLGEENILELESAGDVFNGLMEQVEDLKIEVYEESLRRQRAEFDYMQLQIKPHFYLNCMNIIYNMAQTKNYREIQRLSLTVCKYLRSMFRNGMVPVPIEEELSLVQSYLDIQRIRYDAQFSYLIEQDPATAGALIAPLIIHTLVENSIKHNITQEGSLTVRVRLRRVMEDGLEALSIRVEDTGGGFEEDILALLQSGRRPGLADGRGIGLYNTRQRLEILYGGHGSIRFANREEGGARVDILIPLQKPPAAGRGVQP